MTQHPFIPTDEQNDIIRHDGSAFVTACPGAGKTRIMIERARRLFHHMPVGRGVAFLSFTHAAVFELGRRLRHHSLLPTPSFPNFLGTFDSFVWAFLVAPFGIKGSDKVPRLIPDISTLLVRPFPSAHPLPLSCFCARTGVLFQPEAKKHGFDVAKRATQVQAYTTAATRLRQHLCERGQLGFDEARAVAIQRINEQAVTGPIATALARRFIEVIVDEAQDCNPQDLSIISWLRDSGIPVKVVCDPNQAIYAFRGGVTDHLDPFRMQFMEQERMWLTGNFRSSSNICMAISQLRPPWSRSSHDVGLGPFRDWCTSVRILAYRGNKVPATIGAAFCRLLREEDMDVASAPIVASTMASAAAAAGQPRPTKSEERSIRLAEAVTAFHFAAGFDDMKLGLEHCHRVLLEIEGRMEGISYHQYLADHETEPLSWRSRVVSILRALRFDPGKYSDAKSWHEAAKDLLANQLTVKDGPSISQRLRWSQGLPGALAVVPSDTPMARTIHSVKGREYPAVCVVTTSATLGSILDFLNSGEPSDRAEDARKLYVAASRAERLLVLAAPRSQSERLQNHLRSQGSVVAVDQI